MEMRGCPNLGDQPRMLTGYSVVGLLHQAGVLLLGTARGVAPTATLSIQVPIAST